MRKKLKIGRLGAWAAALTLFLLAAPAVRADTPSLNRPFLKSSPGGQVVLDMQPADPVGETGRGAGEARDKEGKVLWKVEWFALPGQVIVLDDGLGLVRLGPWATRFQELDDLAVAFYQEGRVVRGYIVADLVRDRTKLIRTASHYFWMAREYPTALSQDQKRFSIFTLDGRTHHFDTSTGESMEVTGEDRKIAKARRLFSQAQKLSNQGRKAEALEKLKTSYQVWPNLLLRPVIERLGGKLP